MEVIDRLTESILQAGFSTVGGSKRWVLLENNFYGISDEETKNPPSRITDTPLDMHISVLVGCCDLGMDVFLVLGEGIELVALCRYCNIQG